MTAMQFGVFSTGFLEQKPPPTAPVVRAPMSLKVAMQQLDSLGEIVEVLREELSVGRPAAVPDAPTHAARVTASESKRLGEPPLTSGVQR